jgi:FtsP/CotA-like multicopper oxidase with cupredoxin domain
MEKISYSSVSGEGTKTRRSDVRRAIQVVAVGVVAYLTWLLFANVSLRWHDQTLSVSEVPFGSRQPAIVRQYNLTVGARWMNLDGGRWRPMFVCNGESPCPTLTAKEGDEVHIHVINDLGAQLSIHWSGIAHRRLGFWNDGTGGLNQYPILPRGNWTSKFDTTDHWGLNWYADHTGAGVADGVYGMVYVAPSPSRARPYHLITDSLEERRLIREAEENIQHLALWNSDFRTADWKITEMKATGRGLYCYKSILVNGKGRTFCKNPDFDTIDGRPLDEAGCVIQDHLAGDKCTPSLADFQVIETHGAPFVMLNLVNVGFEHALKFSIDSHAIWVVADDAGFIEPQKVNVLYITNGARYTVLIKADHTPGDYAMRLASTSTLQNLEGMAILRYPAKRYPKYGQPMQIPVSPDTEICLNADSSVPHGCKELVRKSVRTLSGAKPPAHAQKTLRWSTGSRTNPVMPMVQEYFVNEKPWQLFRAAMEPVLFNPDAPEVEKPIQRDLPVGTVVDLIVQNTLNETIPMYKHGNPTFLLGSRAYEKFAWSTVEEAMAHDEGRLALDVDTAPLGVVHDLPPLGWLAIRWKVSVHGATMFHAVKLRYFAVSLSGPESTVRGH